MAAQGFLRLLAELRTIFLRDSSIHANPWPHGLMTGPPSGFPGTPCGTTRSFYIEAGLCGVCCSAVEMPGGQHAPAAPSSRRLTGTSTTSIRGPSGPGQTPGDRDPTRGDPDRTPEGPREARRPGLWANGRRHPSCSCPNAADH
jgi:hypothetical protein